MQIIIYFKIIKDENSFFEILPENCLEVGKSMGKIHKFKNYAKNDLIKFFDEILNRPFLEILLISFYFTNNSNLQNSLMNLIHRCCSQKKTFAKNIQNIEFLFVPEHTKLFETLHNLVKKLTILALNNQV